MTDPREERLRALYAAVSAPDPSPTATASDEEWTVWMDRIGADADLAGLLHSAAHGERFTEAELRERREASERAGSQLAPEELAEAYDLLAQP